MRYRIVLASKMGEELRKHILSDRSKEQMAITLCGINYLRDEIRLLCRHLILLPPEAFCRQSSAYIEILPEVQRHILRLAAEEGLSQIDWHSHPGESPIIGFSSIDDHHEKRLAKYLNKKIPETFYASVVMNQNALDARIWQINGQKVESTVIESIKHGDFTDQRPYSLKREILVNKHEMIDERFSRQVLAFGIGLQERLRQCRIGIIGVGGLGGIIVEMLSRMGASHWVLVDDDVSEGSNLNRLPGSTQKDVYNQTLKVNLAQRNIFRANPYASVKGLPLSVLDPRSIQALKSCDLLIVSTDNHSSRLVANRISVQYLIPLIHVGVNIDIDNERKITDISGEYACPSLGEWCLQCSGIIDSQMAGWELADEGLRTTLKETGYVKNTPAPAVYHLNGTVASLAVAEIHNFLFPYKPFRRYMTYDELKGELFPLEVQSKGDCPVCDADGGFLGLGDLEPFPDYETKERTIPFSDQFGIEEPNEEEKTDSFPETTLDAYSQRISKPEEDHPCSEEYLKMPSSKGLKRWINSFLKGAKSGTSFLRRHSLEQ